MQKCVQKTRVPLCALKSRVKSVVVLVQNARLDILCLKAICYILYFKLCGLNLYCKLVIIMMEIIYLI